VYEGTASALGVDMTNHVTANAATATILRTKLFMMTPCQTRLDSKWIANLVKGSQV